MTDLEKYLYQLRRIEEHREVAAEKEIRKIYKKTLKELQNYLADIYSKYSVDDILTYGELARVGMDARFLEEVELRLNGITPEVSRTINETVTQTYEACYNGMTAAVTKAAGNREALLRAFATVAAVTPDIIKQAVNNPIAGLTLKDTLEKHRKDIIYNIKREIGVGLSNGDRFTTMAKRISSSLDGDYIKAVRIVRTEAHRCRESGYNDAATELNSALQNGNSGYVMAKTWRTMQDERVRPNTVYRTKKGWKQGKKSKYNHEKMDGVTIPQDELFELPSGAKCMCPSQTGVAGEDINCRCYVSYSLVRASDLKGYNKSKDKPAQPSDIDMGNMGEKIPSEHIEEMQKRLSNAPQAVQDVWNNYAGDIAINDINSRSAYFSPSRFDYGVHVKLDSVTKPRYSTVGGQKQLFKNEYGTMFHEIGHNIADVANKRYGGYSWHDISETFKSKKHLFGGGVGYTLDDMVKAEAQAKVSSTWARLKEEAVKRGEKKSSVRKYLAYNAIANELKGTELIAAADCMDMFEGATKGAISTYCGHGASYWKSHNVGVEAFAEMFDATINNPKSLEIILKYFPKSYDIFIECLEHIAKLK